MYSLTRVLIDCPAGEDADRHQEGRQEDERQRDAVDAHVVGDGAAEPGRFSTNWKSGSAGSKCDQRSSDSSEGDAAWSTAPIQRALRARPVAARRAISRMNSRADQRQEGDEGEDRPEVISARSREHEPGHERRDADQHGEGIVIEIAGLQPHRAAGDVEHPRRHAVRPQAVDQPAVAVFHRARPSHYGRAHEDAHHRARRSTTC